MKFTEAKLRRGAWRKEGTATEPFWPGVRQGLLRAALSTSSHAPVLGSNPNAIVDSYIWLPSPHWLRSWSHVRLLLVFQTCPPPSYLSALAGSSAWNFPPTNFCLVLPASTSAVS